MLLAMIASGIIMGAELLSGAVSNEMNEAAGLFEDDDCGNQGGGDGTGGAGPLVRVAATLAKGGATPAYTNLH